MVKYEYSDIKVEFYQKAVGILGCFCRLKRDIRQKKALRGTPTEALNGVNRDLA